MGIMGPQGSRSQVKDLITKGRVSVVTLMAQSLNPIGQTRTETNGKSYLLCINRKSAGLMNWSLNWMTKKEGHAP